ncbi:MAG: hypothetical protein ACK4NP_14065, partial [Parvularculaceae bacterium]
AMSYDPPSYVVNFAQTRKLPFKIAFDNTGAIASAWGDVRLTPQASEGVTYAAKITAAEARIDWTRPAAAIDGQIRGLSPYPGAWFEADAGKGSERVKALLSRKAAGAGPAGTVLDTEDRLVVAAGEGAVELLTVQRAGRAAQDAAAFLRGFPLRAGDRLR